MAITYVNGASTHGTSASPVVNLPASTAANDIIMFGWATNTTANATGSPPAGVTKLDEQDASGGDQSGGTFWYRCTGSEGATLTFTSIFDASEIFTFVALAYRGCKTSGSPINANATPEESASGTPKDTPSVTPTVNDCAIVGFFCIDPGVDPLAFTPDASVNYRAGGSVAPVDGQNGVSTLVIAIDRILTGGSGTPITIGGDLAAADGASEFAYALEPAAAAAAVIPDLVMARFG